ncbi:hypothetical protein [Hymenobacter guriensis]|uniref:DUF4105 domain-containing protein n=1 Tax=Hymenobacter guriensis TaxID=2793065 RepID=A0ABS0L6T3_9BACT|nr:hypothetical protein [Hymenobacter guriensis]MBG8555864.1 hypothetical protein [Hymenobacter guriensis]
MITAFHYSRRHRRRLFFPPGLLALAWLLWLGCVMLPRIYVHKQPEILLPIFPIFKTTPLRYEYGSPPYFPVYSSEVQLENFRQWQTFTLVGNLWADYLTLRQIQEASYYLRTTRKKYGYRVYFSPMATYGSFIRVINQLDEYQIFRLWIDWTHKPEAIYVFPNGRSPTDLDVVPVFQRYRRRLIIYPGNALRRSSRGWITSTDSSPLLHAPWRASTLLLLLMALLGSWKLRRLNVL